MSVSTFVTGINDALRRARAQAGGRDVLVMGADAALQVLGAGLADVLDLHIVRVLLGSGLRVFGPSTPVGLELRRLTVTDAPSVTHLKFAVEGE